MCVHAQLCLILYDPVDCSPPGSSVHGIFQVRILEWVAISFSKVRTTFLKKNFFLNLFIWLCWVFIAHTGSFNCSMWGLVP